MIKGIHHVALVVETIDAVLPYYCHAAGLTRLADVDALAISPTQRKMKVSGLRPCLLAGPNAYLKLLSRPLTSPAAKSAVDPIHRPGIRHFCVQNRDCANLETAVRNTGGSLIAPPLDLGTGNQYAYARDPEGNIMEIEGLPYAPAGEPTWIGHVAIVTRDMDAAVGFYGALFGAEPNSRGRFGPGPQFDRMGGLVDAQIEGAWLPTGNILLELWQFHAPDYQGEQGSRDPLDQGYSHLALETDALDADAARLVQLGGTLLTQCSENDQVRSVFAYDPEGNLIELLELRKPSGALSIAGLAEPSVCARVEAARSANRRSEQSFDRR